jgi:hypothetical protein
MSGGYISFFNDSTRFSDADLSNAIPDFQYQISFEFNWYWGLDAFLDQNGYGTPVFIVDYPGPNDPQGALGYHYVDANYQPYAVIFAGLCEDYGYPVTGVISHELLELLADQLTDTVDLYDNGDGTGVIVLQEVCDPVEENVYYEAPNGNIVSDFATPDWYAPGSPGPYDLLRVVPGAWQLASGGYVSYQYVTLSGWQQAFGDQVAKVAESSRHKQTSSGNPRTDVIRRIQAERSGIGQRQPATVGGGSQPNGHAKGQGKGHGKGEAASQTQGGPAQQRAQSAKKAGDLTVVSRQDVPVIPAQSQRRPSRQTAMSGGPRAQQIPSQ